nr:hypothetical protein CPGR_04957 [Mycolicibacter nonchromogenicus]
MGKVEVVGFGGTQFQVQAGVVVEPERALLQIQAPLQGAGTGGGLRDGGQHPR